jgi:DNA mismatch endonuclease Vsr
MPTWDKLDGNFGNFLPKNMRPSTLQREVSASYKRFFGPKQVLRKLRDRDFYGALKRVMYAVQVWEIRKATNKWPDYLDTVEGRYYDENKQLIESMLGEEGVHPAQFPGSSMGAGLENAVIGGGRGLGCCLKSMASAKSKYQPWDPTRVSANMAKIRRQGSKIERKLGSAMWAAGLRYRKQYPIEGRPDFVFLKAKVAVFCDSHFWHGYHWVEKAKSKLRKNREFWVAKIERNMLRDREVEEFLLTQRWVVLRFWEHEINESLQHCVSTVQKALTISHVP